MQYWSWNVSWEYLPSFPLKMLILTGRRQSLNLWTLAAVGVQGWRWGRVNISEHVRDYPKTHLWLNCSQHLTSSGNNVPSCEVTQRWHGSRKVRFHGSFWQAGGSSWFRSNSLSFDEGNDILTVPATTALPWHHQRPNKYLKVGLRAVSTWPFLDLSGGSINCHQSMCLFIDFSPSILDSSVIC